MRWDWPITGMFVCVYTERPMSTSCVTLPSTSTAPVWICPCWESTTRTVVWAQWMIRWRHSACCRPIPAASSHRHAETSFVIISSSLLWWRRWCLPSSALKDISHTYSSTKRRRFDYTLTDHMSTGNLLCNLSDDTCVLFTEPSEEGVWHLHSLGVSQCGGWCDFSWLWSLLFPFAAVICWVGDWSAKAFTSYL